MYKTAVYLAEDGYCCNTGAALGADQTFANGAASVDGAVQLFIPWNNYEKDWIHNLGGPGFFPDIYIANPIMDAKAFESVNIFHPAADKLSRAIKALHARNWLIINKTQFIVCWSPKGEVVGGTGQALRIAASMGMPIYNLGNQDTLNAFIEKLNERDIIKQAIT